MLDGVLLTEHLGVLELFLNAFGSVPTKPLCDRAPSQIGPVQYHAIRCLRDLRLERQILVADFGLHAEFL
jgi:hypothetical protein